MKISDGSVMWWYNFGLEFQMVTKSQVRMSAVNILDILNILRFQLLKFSDFTCWHSQMICQSMTESELRMHMQITCLKFKVKLFISYRNVLRLNKLLESSIGKLLNNEDKYSFSNISARGFYQAERTWWHRVRWKCLMMVYHQERRSDFDRSKEKTR